MFFNTDTYKNITAGELNGRIEQGEDLFLLDVRTRAEHAAQAIDGSHLIPVQELAHRAAELPRDREIVVYCRVGNRSAFAATYLARLGYNVTNLEGGILAWSMTEHAAFAGVA